MSSGSSEEIKSDLKAEKQSQVLEHAPNYTFLSNINNQDEEKKLLQSTNGLNLHEDSISKASSQLDSSINISDSNFNVSKLYQGPSQKGEENQGNPENKAFKSKFRDRLSGLSEKLREFARNLFDLGRWNRDYDSFNQLYFQILFDGFSIFYLSSKYKQLKQQRLNSLKDEKFGRENVENLQKNGFRLYLNSKLEQNTIIYAVTTSYYFNKYIKNKNQSNQETDPNEQCFDVWQVEIPENIIRIQLDDHFIYENKIQTSYSPQNSFLTKLALSSFSLLKLFTSKLSKSKIEISSDHITSQFYIFGQKVILKDGKVGLRVKQIFSQFDFSQFKIEQAVYLFQMLLAAGVCTFFALKLVKNLIYLARKKKLIKKKYLVF
ncbi:transmembrane protein, putative (macronuclear) [Tetrahymena thermophila SB210]|uniref:Transmembrane protein, putative n=1 Tax=Tetrahymena thermophila (strain SB210) TaxID=312017 RepID=Q23UB6_TETTS|nr:transmembrane protein, putative [Tetrahymena thermophila SB210]EAS00149.1 transmembrane protein, putative [Tetrahymena thermophila SB210]|eukprot:XP_001020394.1 transmembrane protein, putative [Tetrahymena thermophila SB210]